MSIRPPPRSHPTVRRITAAWRQLTGGSAVRDTERPTLIACSGGPDSSALTLALATVTPRPIVAHILHDLRPEAEAAADQRASASLAQALGLSFCTEAVHIAAHPGNAEANARRARYAALARLAAGHGCVAVATAHHADDQAETILMRLLRGAGPIALGGIAPSRPLQGTIRLIRPALDIPRLDLLALCETAGHTAVTDRTNLDTTKTRAYLRARVLPALRAAHPAALAGLARSAALARDAGRFVRAAARERLAAATTIPNGLHWPRDAFLGCANTVVCECLRLAHHQLTSHNASDRLPMRSLRLAAHHMQSAPTSPSIQLVLGYTTLHIDSTGLSMICRR